MTGKRFLSGGRSLIGGGLIPYIQKYITVTTIDLKIFYNFFFFETTIIKLCWNVIVNKDVIVNKEWNSCFLTLKTYRVEIAYVLGLF